MTFHALYTLLLSIYKPSPDICPQTLAARAPGPRSCDNKNKQAEPKAVRFGWLTDANFCVFWPAK